MIYSQLPVSERRVIEEYLSRLKTLCAEHPDAKVSVEDEEVEIYHGPFDRTAIVRNTGHTEITMISVHVSATESHKAVFIHGNGEDVYSDSAWTEVGAWLEERLGQRELT